jgi:hypothetical protein
MCNETDCNIQPTFNKEGEKKALYCSAHKMEGMVNVISKTCLECNKRPAFNTQGEKKALYCSAHKMEGMVDVKNKTCIHEGCNKHPIFNKNSETKALYCSAHKMEGMVNVITKTCIHEGCNKHPTFNINGETKTLYCSAHKIEGMVDVKNKTCIECNKQPVFNKNSETKALYCSAHKMEGMVNVISKTCIHEGCNKRPLFNINGEIKTLYCSAHKMEGMVNVISKTCKSVWCSTHSTEKYDGYCLFCYTNLFPDKPVSRNYKTKEYTVVEYIKTKFPNLNWIADKIVSGGCSKRRPDLVLDLLYQIIIVEIDENQHTNYDCSCENKRTMELSQDFAHRPIVFIRFNPDDYEKNGTNVTSCWGIDKRGMCIVKKSKNSEWTERLNVLEEHINYWINPINTTNKTIETIQLFYDV